MPKLIFRGAFIRFVDLRYDDKSKTTYTKIHWSAAFTDPVREAMDWGEVPSGFASAKLDGRLIATLIEVIPNGELKNNAFDLDAKEVGGFELHRITSDDGDSVENELRFQITTAAVKAAQKLAGYLAVIGKGEAQLKITYEAQSELEEEADAAQGRLISEGQAADTAEAADEPALASAAQMKRRGARDKERAEKVN